MTKTEYYRPSKTMFTVKYRQTIYQQHNIQNIYNMYSINCFHLRSWIHVFQHRSL